MFRFEDMDYDSYDEVINGEKTYKQIAKCLIIDKRPCIIGWTDEGYEHRDVMFTWLPKRLGGNLQRGFHNCFFYVSIMACNSYAFLIESDTVNTKDNSYIEEKLNLRGDNYTKKMCELINGVIHEIDLLINEDVFLKK